MITIQKYVRAQSLEEAWQLNQNKRNRVLGGMLWLNAYSGNSVANAVKDIVGIQFRNMATVGGSI